MGSVGGSFVCDWNRLVWRKSERWCHSTVQELVVPVVHPCYGRHRCDVLPAALGGAISNDLLCHDRQLGAGCDVRVGGHQPLVGWCASQVCGDEFDRSVRARTMMQQAELLYSHVLACCCAATPARRSCRCTFPSRLWSTRLWSESAGVGFARTRQHWLRTPSVSRRGC